VPPQLIAAAGYAWPHWAAGAHVTLGLFWVAFINVAVLLVFFGAAVRGGRRAKGASSVPDGSSLPEGARAASTQGAPAPCTRARSSQDAGTVALLRVSDSEREHAIQLIRHGIGEGRLGLEEGIERIERCLTVRYRGELSRLVEDLPEPAARDRASARRAPLRAVAVITAIAAVVVQFVAGMWVLWPVAIASFAPFLFMERGTDRR